MARAPRDGRSLAPIRSPEIDPDKTKDTAPAQTVLGIVTNLSFVSSAEPRVLFSVDPERRDAIVASQVR